MSGWLARHSPPARSHDILRCTPPSKGRKVAGRRRAAARAGRARASGPLTPNPPVAGAVRCLPPSPSAAQAAGKVRHARHARLLLACSAATHGWPPGELNQQQHPSLRGAFRAAGRKKESVGLRRTPACEAAGGATRDARDARCAANPTCCHTEWVGSRPRSSLRLRASDSRGLLPETPRVRDVIFAGRSRPCLLRAGGR